METLKMDLQNVMNYLDSLVYDETLSEAIRNLDTSTLGGNLSSVSNLLTFKIRVNHMVDAYKVLMSMANKCNQ